MSSNRFMKLKDASELPINQSGFRACRWCGGDVKPPKRTMCSDECKHEILLRTNSSYFRDCVYKRDKGICALCGIDTKETAKTALSLEGDERSAFLQLYSIPESRKIRKVKYGGSLWDADHIVRVVDGGGECGLDNIRTLCISCHKIITKTGNSKN